MKNLMLKTLFMLILVAVQLTSNAQDVPPGPIQKHTTAPEVVDILSKTINISDNERTTINGLFSTTRFSSTLLGDNFKLTDINQLLLLKDLLDILPSDRTIKNEFKKGLGTSYCCDQITDPCIFSAPTNNAKTADKFSVNYQLGGLSATNALQNNWVDAAFDINLKNACSNTTSPIMYVGIDKRFGFGTNQPMATYHFTKPDMLIGSTTSFNFSINDEPNKEHLKLANSGDILFLVDRTGKAYAKEFEVSLNIPFPDYVFNEDYKLLPLNKLDEYIKTNKHLPGIKSASEYEESGKVNIAELQIQLLEKVEELTLHTINQEKKINEQSAEIDALKKMILEIKSDRK